MTDKSKKPKRPKDNRERFVEHGDGIVADYSEAYGEPAGWFTPDDDDETADTDRNA